MAPEEKKDTPATRRASTSAEKEDPEPEEKAPTPEERKVSQLIEVVEKLLAESQAGRAQLQAIVQERLDGGSIRGTGPYENCPDEVEASETQGRTLFSYGVMSNLLGRGGVATTRVKVDRGGMELLFSSLIQGEQLPSGISTAWVRASDGTEELIDSFVDSSGMLVAYLTEITDDKDIQQIELRNAKRLPLALGGALPRRT